MVNSKMISIIIGSYNGADFLRETVDSFLGQTYQNIELILVDDGSTDNTYQIMEYYASKDERVKVVRQKNSGASAARETGYRIATGEYLILSDDDDVWSSSALEEMLQLMNDTPDVDAVGTLNRHMSDNNKIRDYDWNENKHNDCLAQPELLTGHEYAIRTLSRQEVRYCNFWGILFKKRVFDNIVDEFISYKEKIPTHYFNDSFSSCKVVGCLPNIMTTNKVHILYRIDTSSLSHKSAVSLHTKHAMYASEEALRYYKELGWQDMYEKTLPGWYLLLLRTWFMIYAHEEEEEEKAVYLSEVRRLYDLYYSDLKAVSRKGLKQFTMFLSIVLWDKCPKLWFKLIRMIKGW